MQVLLPPLAGTTATMETAGPDTGAGTNPALLRGRVLLVDDDADVNGFMVDLLESWGLEVVAFHDAVEAARAFAAAPDGYQLAILDQTMPRMTGTELARHLHQLRTALPLILYTGQAGQLPETTLAELGIRALLRKPVAVERLRALLETLTGR
jgi:CheY-like chemotaxis protein